MSENSSFGCNGPLLESRLYLHKKLDFSIASVLLCVDLSTFAGGRLCLGSRLHWWHKGNADKICITSGSFIGKGLLAAVAGKLNCAASSLARDRQPLEHRALQVSFTVNVPQVLRPFLGGCF